MLSQTLNLSGKWLFVSLVDVTIFTYLTPSCLVSSVPSFWNSDEVDMKLWLEQDGFGWKMELFLVPVSYHSLPLISPQHHAYLIVQLGCTL